MQSMLRDNFRDTIHLSIANSFHETTKTYLETWWIDKFEDIMKYSTWAQLIDDIE